MTHGDMREVLARMPQDCVDSCVTDPPYGLSFMERGWDHEVPGPGHWKHALRALKPGAHLLAFGGTRKEHRLVCALEDAGFEIRDKLMWLYGQGFPKSHNRKEEGLGTALKPAWEPIVLARKPFKGPVYVNVDRYGTGALNIDACRIPSEGNEHFRSEVVGRSGGFVDGADARTAAGMGSFAPGASFVPTNSPLGRWPANLILDEEAGALLDAQTGAVPGQRGRAKTDGTELTRTIYDGGRHYASDQPEPRGDEGGPSRFFYCPKATKKEREAGLDYFEATIVNDGRETAIDNPYQRGDTKRKNTCPTVKPIALMRWLCRLITPPGGLVLDTFAGSGSTGCAASLEGFRFMGVDADRTHYEIACARIEHWRREAEAA